MLSFAAFLALQTDTGKRWLAIQGASILKGFGIEEVSVGRIGGIPPFSLQINQLAMKIRGQDDLFTAEEIFLRWRPSDLLQGRIHIIELSAARVAIPAGITAQKKSVNETSIPGRWFGILGRLSIEGLRIDRISLAKGIFNSAQEFKLLMSTTQVPEGTQILLKTSGVSGTYLSASVAIRDKGNTFTLSAEGGEPAGGAVSELASLGGPLGFSLHGEGNVSEWKGRLELEAGEEISLSLGLDFDRKDGLSLKGEGEILTRGLPATMKSLSDRWEERKCTQIVEKSRVGKSQYATGSESFFDNCLLKTYTAFSIYYLPAKNELDIESLLLKGDLFQLDLSGRLLVTGLYFKGDYSLSIAGAGPLVGISSKGPLSLTGRIEGPLPEPSLEGKLEIRGISSESFNSDSIKASFILDLSKLMLSGSGELKNLVLTRPEGISEPSLLWEAEDIHFSGEEVRVSRLVIRSSYGEADLSGNISLSLGSYSAFGTLIPSDPAKLSSILGTTLPVSLKTAFSIKGDILQETAAGQIKGSAVLDSRFISEKIPGPLSGMLAEDIFFMAFFELDRKRHLKILSAEIKDGKARLSGSGVIALKEASVTASWLIDIPDASLMFPEISSFSSGSVRMKGHLSGPLSQPILDVELALDGLHANISLRRISDSLAGNLRINGELRGMAVDLRSALEVGEGVLKLKKIAFNACDITAGGDITIDTSDMTLNGKILAEMAAASCLGRSIGFNGAFSMDALLKKGAKGQDIDLTFTGRDISLKDYSLSSMTGRIRISNAFVANAIKAEGRLKNLHLGRLDFSSADIEFEYGEASKRLAITKAYALYEAVPLRLFNPMILRADNEEIILEDTEIGIGGPESVSDHGRTGSGILPPDPALKKADNPPLTGLRLHIGAVLKANRLKALLRLEGLEEKSVMATADIPLYLRLYPFSLNIPADGIINGDLSAEIDIGRLARALDLMEPELAGKFLCSISLGGSIADPALKGEFRLQDGLFSYRRAGLLLSDITVEARVSEGTVKILRAEAGDGKNGRLSVNGSAIIFPRKDTSLDMNIYLERFLMLNRNDIRTEATGKAYIKGSLENLFLTGRLMVGPGDLRIPGRLPPDLVELEVIEIPAPLALIKQKPESPHRFFKNISLDLLLESPGRIFLRGRGLESEWEGQMHLTGSAQRPDISGILSIVRGRFNLLGRRFDLKEGTLVLSGDSTSSTHINALAEASASGLTARINVTGTLSAPVFTLSSDPPMPSDEILARILFGRSLSRITPLQALTLADAAMTLTGGGGGLDIMGRARKILGVDNIEVKMGDRDNGDPSIGVGNYLGDKVFLQVERGIHPKSSKTSVEVEILPEISLESEVGADSEGGIGIIWRWDY